MIDTLKVTMGEYTDVILQYVSIKHLALGKSTMFSFMKHTTLHLILTFICFYACILIHVFISNVLAALVLQNTFLVVFMRLSRTYKGPLYASRCVLLSYDTNFDFMKIINYTLNVINLI